ncbi:MAG: amidohydrolase [Pseudomonadota bacterium]
MTNFNRDVGLLFGALAVLAAWATPALGQDQMVTVYIAEKIITMDPGLPEATAVAVKDGRIAAVGEFEDLASWIDQFPHEIDRSFEGKVLVPGLIASHEHPILAANTITHRPLLAFYSTPNPFGTDIAGVASKEEALDRLRDEVARNPSPDETLFTWGYDVIAMGGHLTRPELDAISTTRPIVIWDASVHFAYANSPYLAQIGVTAEDAAKIPGIELGPDGEPNGQFLATEAAAFALIPEITKATANMRPAVDQIIALNRQAGITTTTELAFGTINPEFESQFLNAYFNDAATPLRIVVVADAASYEKLHGDGAVEAVTELSEDNTEKVIYSGIKFFADDAFLGLAMALREPGYLDPSLQGIWNTRPEDMVDVMRPWWEAGFRIHIHSNGDASHDAVLDALAELQAVRPRFDHRFVFEHFGLSSLDQIRRMKALGAVASVNPSYVYLRGDLNASYIGRNRAAQAARLGTLTANAVPTTIHSDLPVAPAEPLLLMWMAVNRLGQSGEVLAPAERVNAEEALRMVTLDAAYVLGIDDRVGSIEPGKHADFTVLEANPLEVEPEIIRDIEVWGTVFGGQKFPASLAIK